MEKNMITCLLYFQVGISCYNTIESLCDVFQIHWGGGTRIENNQ